MVTSQDIYSNLILLNCSADFDAVHHAFLPEILSSLGFHDDVLPLVSSYLSGCSFGISSTMLSFCFLRIPFLAPSSSCSRLFIWVISFAYTASITIFILVDCQTNCPFLTNFTSSWLKSQILSLTFPSECLGSNSNLTKKELLMMPSLKWPLVCCSLKQLSFLPHCSYVCIVLLELICMATTFSQKSTAAMKPTRNHPSNDG